MMHPQLIAIGTSAGGVTALQKIFSQLDANLNVPVVVTQHMPQDARIDFSLVFGRFSSRPMVEAEDKMPLQPGRIYFAPPGYHLLIEKARTLALNQDEMVCFSRPSIDVMFESAARVYGPGLVAVLLTGANHDGAEGMKQVGEAGGYTLVEDPASAEVGTMPQSALNKMKPDLVLPLDQIALQINRLARGAQHG